MPRIGVEDHARLCAGLKGLGRIRHEALGVAYVDAAWGFLVVPPTGFPELKLNFYRQTTDTTVAQVLRQIAGVLGMDANRQPVD